jgi:serine/threonine-protein kinase
MLTDEGVLKIIDFGISCLVNPAQRGLSPGNPSYMSPERLQGCPLDSRTDIYALAMIAYEMLAGALPFPPKTPAAKLHTMLPPRLPGVPAEIGSVLAKALAIRPEARWESVAAFVNRFAQVATPFITPTVP